MPTSASDTHGPAERPGRRIKPLYVLGAVCLVSALMIGVGVLTGGDEDPDLTRGDYDAALARWKAKGPPNYDLDAYFFSQNSPVDMHLEVRDGKPVVLTKNGARMTQESRREEWTVDAMLQRIGQDLRTQESPNPDFGVRPGVKVKLKAAFDETFGYPTLYRRIALGAPVQYSYEVKAFTPLN
jgi:hypothetical protein